MSDSTGDEDDLDVWIRRPENRAIIAKAKAVSDAVNHERGINDDLGDDVAPAQVAVTAALAGFYAASGADKSISRLVVGFALNKPRASDVEVERVMAEVEADPNAVSEPQRRIVRAMTMRAVTALELLSHRITAFAAWMLFLGVNGRKAIPGEVWRHTPTAGVDADTAGGPVEGCKAKLVNMIGYTAGREGLPVTHRLTAPLLGRALEAWDDMRAHSRYPLPRVRLRTIRGWCRDAGLSCSTSSSNRLTSKGSPIARSMRPIRAGFCRWSKKKCPQMPADGDTFSGHRSRAKRKASR